MKDMYSFDADVESSKAAYDAARSAYAAIFDRIFAWADHSGPADPAWRAVRGCARPTLTRRLTLIQAQWAARTLMSITLRTRVRHALRCLLMGSGRRHYPVLQPLRLCSECRGGVTEWRGRSSIGKGPIRGLFPASSGRRECDRSDIPALVRSQRKRFD